MINRKKLIISLGCLALGLSILNAQPSPPPGPPPSGIPGVNGPPPPPSPGQPAPGLPGTPPAPPTPPPPAGWGYPGYLSVPPSGDWMNEGTLNVMATGYDTESVLVQIPLVVSYSYNGAFYDVTVLNSWNPYTQSWNIGVDVQANSTSYYFNGFNYNYYAVLPTGTYYFNL